MQPKNRSTDWNRGRPESADRQKISGPAEKKHAAGQRQFKTGKPAPELASRQPGQGENSQGIRLNKAIADSGLCSRRKADELILAGRVQVNGRQEANPACRVKPGDSLAVDCKPLASKQRICHLLLNKPVACVCTMHDPEGRSTVLDHLPPELAGLRLYPVGRLDFFSEGLLIMTNDGELAHRLAHPRHHQAKVYQVLLRDKVPGQALDKISGGMRLAEGDEVMPVKILENRPMNENTLLTLELRQGLNRQIRRMCRDLGLTILRLKRIAQASLKLGDLQPGQCRLLKDDEVAALRRSVGL